MATDSRFDRDGETMKKRPDPVQTIVVVGNGPVGFRFVQQLVERQPLENSRIIVFGEERHPAYNRIHLTEFLNGGSPELLQYQPQSWYAAHRVELFCGDPVVAIDRSLQQVRSRSGRMFHYDRLVLATGSRPFMPPIPGIEQNGVFPYRTFEDLTKIAEQGTLGKRVVILGGGLLGLEAAVALNKLGWNVFVVEKAPVVMPRQLDNQGATLLRQLLEMPKLRLLLQRQTEKISRIDEGLHVQFTNGESVVADLVVVSAGIQPRDELARECNLPLGRRGGIIVDDHLQTSDPNISAIGECAEHNGQVYGLVAPGFQMANTLADRIHGQQSVFVGGNQATRLKLAGVTVMFSGDYLDTSQAQVLVWQTSNCYVKLVLRKSRLVGLIGVGEIPQRERLQEAIDRNRRLAWWNRRRFEATGRIWSGSAAPSVNNWPATAIVCNCEAVTRGQLTDAQIAGCSTVEDLAAATRASTVCGSCRPLLQQLAGHRGVAKSSSVSDQIVTLASLLALLIVAVMMIAKPLAMRVSVQESRTVWQTLITDDFWKQITGYSILTLIGASLLIAARKRTRLANRFPLASMRATHVILTTVALLVLIAHTGFHRGHNLNFALFCSFLLASLSGAVTGILAGTESRLPQRLRMLRRPLTLWHIACVWPLPLLIAFHIVSVYWL